MLAERQHRTQGHMCSQIGICFDPRRPSTPQNFIERKHTKAVTLAVTATAKARWTSATIVCTIATAGAVFCFQDDNGHEHEGTGTDDMASDERKIRLMFVSARKKRLRARLSLSG